MYSIDGEGAGYLSVDDFLQVLTSRDLGFQLEENEQAYIANQVMLDALYTTHTHNQYIHVIMLILHVQVYQYMVNMAHLCTCVLDIYVMYMVLGD